MDDLFSHQDSDDNQNGIHPVTSAEQLEQLRRDADAGADQAVGEADNGSRTAALPGWTRLYTLADAFSEREPVEYVVEGLFPIPSLSIIYGLPGDFKSMLLMDAAMCVASGTPWLPPAGNCPQAARTTRQVPVFWYDFDNGKRRCDERFQALAKVRGLEQSPDLPFYYLSVPDPALNFKESNNIAIYLEPKIKEYGIKFLCIDNLTTVSGDVEENSVEMSAVMGNLRKLVETWRLACVVIHHQRKGNATEGHPGESLRGHSSINAAIDLALQVTRKPGTNSVSVRSTKTRGKEVPTFGAEFQYTSRPDDELETGRFFGIRATASTKKEGAEVAIMDLLLGEAALNQSQIVDALQPQKFGKATVRNVLERMVESKQLVAERGAHQKIFYSINQVE